MTFNEFKKVNEDFKRIFGVTSIGFLDSVFALGGIFTIDIVKFDDFLHKKYGEYESEGMSMEEVIYKHYDMEGVNLIKRYIDSI